jgi:hypothetical protein
MGENGSRARSIEPVTSRTALTICPQKSNRYRIKTSSAGVNGTSEIVVLVVIFFVVVDVVVRKEIVVIVIFVEGVIIIVPIVAADRAECIRDGTPAAAR